MASPKIEVFFLYNPATGAPLTGIIAALSFSVYKDELGNNILPLPAFTEIGGGAYCFTPTTTANHGIVYIVNATAAATPQYVSRFIRYEDWYTDNADILTSSLQTDISSIKTTVEDIQLYTEGRWKIFTSGPEANRLLIYAADGLTVLKRYDLLDDAGAPSVINPFERSPV
jgi:hypothetical protein